MFYEIWDCYLNKKTINYVNSDSRLTGYERLYVKINPKDFKRYDCIVKMYAFYVWYKVQRLTYLIHYDRMKFMYVHA